MAVMGILNWSYILLADILHCNKGDSSPSRLIRRYIMSVLALAFPVETAFPLAQSLARVAIGAVRPLLGVGVLATFLVLFKPLIAGFLRAALLVVSPRRPLAQRQARQKHNGVQFLQRLARQYDDVQPSLAAELRSLASRE
jgi:hypothetical protein